MKCDLPTELLSGYIDGELDEQQKSLVEKHLQACPFCQRELEELRQLAHNIKMQDLEEPSRDFVFTLNRRITEKIKIKHHPNIFRLAPILAPVAAVILIVIVVTNITPQKRLVGINDRMLYSEVVSIEKRDVEMAIPKKEKEIAFKRARIEEAFDLAVAPAPTEAAEELKAIEADEISTLEQMALPRDKVIRAIVDTTGKIIRVATGNSIVPEKDTMLENLLSGQQLAPPEIAGQRAQVYIDLAPQKEKTE